MILFKIFRYVSIKYLAGENREEEQGGETWPAKPWGIEKAFELFLRSPYCLLIFWGPFWRREIVIRRNGRSIKIMLPKQKKRGG